MAWRKSASTGPGFSNGTVSDMGAPSGVLQPGPDTAAARQWPEGINP
ncbi:Hypothetical protein RAK1035_0116 [Roseovarius sp. AK1035]|nr:Hypothetical protein RAK1035_0116 [Roseovarius sp. AK1035]